MRNFRYCIGIAIFSIALLIGCDNQASQNNFDESTTAGTEQSELNSTPYSSISNTLPTNQYSQAETQIFTSDAELDQSDSETIFNDEIINDEILKYDEIFSSEVINYEPIIIPVNSVKTIEGFVYYPDGLANALKIDMSITSVLKGDEANMFLAENAPDFVNLESGLEYVIVNFYIHYKEGDVESIRFKEDPARSPSTRFLFQLDVDRTIPINENVYDFLENFNNDRYAESINLGESVTVTLAFVQTRDNQEPLFFWGYDRLIHFEIN